MRFPGFIGGAYRGQSKIAAADQCINWYPEQVESGTGANEYVLYPAPGFTEYCDTGNTDPVRSLYTLNGTRWGIVGDTLYQLPLVSGGSATALTDGINNPDDSPITIASNGDIAKQLVFASAGIVYCYDLVAGTLTAIPDISATVVVYLKGTFYALDPTTNTLYASAPGDGSSWDPLDAIQRTDQGDKWNAMAVVRGDLWLIGSQTGSFFYDTPNGEFPVTLNPSVALAQGINAPNSLRLINGDPIWLSQNLEGGLMVFRGQGYTPQRVSTHAMEYQWAQYAETSDAEAFTYQEQGHEFYVLNFPTANACWVYDGTTGLWHQRGSFNGNDYVALPVRTHLFEGGEHLVGDRTTGVFYQQSVALATDIDGAGLRRRRRCPHLVQELTRTVYRRFHLNMEVGLGLTSGQGSDPLAMLSWSDDGAQSFSGPQEASVGPIGNFHIQVYWGPLGSARDRVFQLDVSDPIPWRIIDAYITADVGTS